MAVVTLQVEGLVAASSARHFFRTLTASIAPFVEVVAKTAHSPLSIVLISATAYAHVLRSAFLAVIVESTAEGTHSSLRVLLNNTTSASS